MPERYIDRGKIKREMILLIYGSLSLMAFNVVPSFMGSLICIVLILPVEIAVILLESKRRIIKYRIQYFIISALVSGYLSLRFFRYWNQIIPTTLLVVIDAFCFVGTCFFVVAVISCIDLLLKNVDSHQSEIIYCNTKIKTPIIICVITAIITITICSKSSPLYPLNDWCDANCFFTVGKSIVNGKIVYKDIYEQKGPLLYFIHSLAYIVSPISFIGVYFVEVLACFVFLFFSYKTMILFCDKNCFVLIPLLSLVVYTSRAFADGDSAEELSIPLIMICMYYGAKSILTNKGIRKKEWLIIGITSGMVLWMKYNFRLLYWIRNSLFCDKDI